jgi:addiction module HigA family antidote
MLIITKGQRIHSPAHPGEILRDLYMEPMHVKITDAADALGVSRKHLSAIIHGNASVTADMAWRLAAAFGNEPEFWVNLQAQYDVWEAGKAQRPKIRKLAAA